MEEFIETEFQMTEQEKHEVMTQLCANVDLATLRRMRELVLAGVATTSAADITPFTDTVSPTPLRQLLVGARLV